MYHHQSQKTADYNSRTVKKEINRIAFGCELILALFSPVYLDRDLIAFAYFSVENILSGVGLSFDIK